MSSASNGSDPSDQVLVSAHTDEWDRSWHVPDPDEPHKPLCGTKNEADEWDFDAPTSVKARGPCEMCMEVHGETWGDEIVEGGPVEVGRYVDLQTTKHAWAQPLEIIDVERAENGGLWSVTVEGHRKGRYRIRPAWRSDAPVARSVTGEYGAGGIRRFEVLEREAVDLGDVPSVAEAWEMVCSRAEVSSHVSFEDVLNAFDGAASMFEVTREARLPREKTSSVASALGLSGAYHTTDAFPPDDLDERIAMLRNGELPDEARARQWGGRDD